MRVSPRLYALVPGGHPALWTSALFSPVRMSLLIGFLISCQISLSPGGLWPCCCPVVLCPSTLAATPPFTNNLPSVPECHPVHLLVANCDMCQWQIGCKSTRQTFHYEDKFPLDEEPLERWRQLGRMSWPGLFQGYESSGCLSAQMNTGGTHFMSLDSKLGFWFVCWGGESFFPPTSSKNRLQPTHSRQNSRHLWNLEAAFKK